MQGNKKYIFQWLVVLAAPFMYWLVLPRHSGDMDIFLLPWFQEIEAGGFDAMSGEYSNYSPPYLYLLGIASIFSQFASPIVLIKAVSIFFTYFLAVVFGLTVYEINKNKNLALLAACVFPLVPSIAINAGWWGQCDAVYTSFLLCAFLFSLKKKPFWVVFFLGLAFSFKAQAVFFLPYLLYLLLKKEVPWKYTLVVPVVFCAMMVPAWLAGREASELARIYMSQADTYKVLSMNAPNPWAWLKHLPFISYEAGVMVGVAATLIANLVLVFKSRSTKDDSSFFRLLLMTATMLISPFLLPKMHERYFYPADVFTMLLAFSCPRFAGVAIAMQIASVSVSFAYLRVINSFREAVSAVACIFVGYALLKVMNLWRSDRGIHPNVPAGGAGDAQALDRFPRPRLP